MDRMALPPHEWDDEIHHTAIATCFDVWFLAHEQGNRVQAHRWQTELRRLTDDARQRRPLAIPAPVLPLQSAPVVQYGTRTCRTCDQPFPLHGAWATLCDACRRAQAKRACLIRAENQRRRRETVTV